MVKERPGTGGLAQLAGAVFVIGASTSPIIALKRELERAGDYRRFAARTLLAGAPGEEHTKYRPAAPAQVGVIRI
jgi:hypothetical protein